MAIQKNLTGRIHGVFGYLYLRKEIVKKGLIDAYSFKSKQTYPVKSFSLQILNNVYHISGNKISQDIVNKIDQLTKGDKIKIFDIKTENIDNSQVEPINIKIKDA